MIALSLGAPEQFGRGVCYPMLDLDGEKACRKAFLVMEKIPLVDLVLFVWWDVAV